MSQPTRQDIIEAHRALTNLSVLASGTSTSSAIFNEKIVRDYLPPFPELTMADIEWDDDVHYLAEAEHPNYGKVIMLWEASIGGITIIEGEIVATVDHDTLTPTGRRYTPTQPQEN